MSNAGQIWASLAAAAALAAVATGCGGGTPQNAGAQRGTFDVEPVSWEFPAEQRLGHPVAMKLALRNADDRAIEDIVVTMDGFDVKSGQPGVADPKRPVWILDGDPPGGKTAYVNTWRLGRLDAGKVRTFVWNVTPIHAGDYELKYTVAAGLFGDAKATLPTGGPVTAAKKVTVGREIDLDLHPDR